MNVTRRAQRMISNVDTWLTSWEGYPGKKRRRLICLHYAGGSTREFTPWLDHLPDDIELLGVQCPGREHRFAERPFRRVPELVSALLPAFAAYTRETYVLFGHSVGALIAFELVRALRRSGLPLPKHLFVAARPAPQVAPDYSPVHNLPRRELIQVLRRYGGTADHILMNEELMAALLPTIRADLEMNRMYSYTPEPKLPLPITTFGGDRDPICPVDDLARWADQTSVSHELFVLPGAHFFIREHRATLIHTIAERF